MQGMHVFARVKIDTERFRLETRFCYFLIQRNLTTIYFRLSICIFSFFVIFWCLFSRLSNILWHNAQNEWTSLIIHDHRCGKFECTSALNKLQIREEWAFFGPPVLIKLLGALAPIWQNHEQNIKNEWFIYGLSTIPQQLKIAKKRPFFVWKLTSSANFWKLVTKSSSHGQTM